ncbi:MAG: methyltransferase domain-containing protein [Alphaproteobacteria bacterium]
MSDEKAVAEHYASDDIAGRILAALRAAGGDADSPTPADLAPLDQFHGRGIEATREIGELLQPKAEEHGLDIGCGIGGPARWLAWTYGCRITGIDLTPAFCDAGVALTGACGLSDQVEIRQASALALPFDDAGFDFAYSQNVVMNIADKAGFHAEATRVLKPGGRLALSNLCLGPGGAPHYPVPWAETPDTSFLNTPEETLAVLGAAGLEVLEFRDTSEDSKRGFAQMRERIQREGPPKLSTVTLMGDRMRQMQRNTARNVEEGRVIPVEILCRRR